MTHRSPVVIAGMGQLGGIFSTGCLRLGHPVYPIRRGDQPHDVAKKVQPTTVIAAVGEDDLPDLLSSLPEAWRGRLTLLSNELLPAIWQAHAIQKPTIISVQFEVKPDRPVVIDRSSPVFGPQADLIIDALKTLSIPTLKIGGLEVMTHHLVLKNLYILTLNLAGLAARATAAKLLDQHRELTASVWAELFALQQAMVKIPLDKAALKQETMGYLALAPERRAGRSAGARLRRTLEHARSLGVEVPTLEKIEQEA